MRKMARKRHLQPTFEKNSIYKPPEENIRKRNILQSSKKHRIMNMSSSANENSNGVHSNEVEVISDGELPMEYQPEDGELSEIRLAFNGERLLIIWDNRLHVP